MTMRISVITVAYNSAATIADTLRSVNAQTHADVEHIVIDGASRDGTVQTVREVGRRVAVLVSEPDQGIYDAMNKGLSRATGEVVGFLNADDCFAHDQVLSHVAASMTDPQVDACYGDLEFVDEHDMRRVLRYWKAGTYVPGACARGWMAPHPTLYVRRGVYERHGPYDPSFRMAADFEMSLRLFDVAGVRAAYLPEVLVHMRTGGASNRGLASLVRNNRETSRACVKHGRPGGLRFLTSRLLLKLPEFFARRSA